MNRKTFLPVAYLFSLALSGCVPVQPHAHFEAVRKLSLERGQAEGVWLQTKNEIQDYAQQSLAIAQDGLTRDEAAHIAVLNNRSLQAELENLGLAAASLTQAKLLRNPNVGALVAFPLSLGSSSLGFAGWLSDLWHLPRRKRVAEIAARRAEYHVAWQVMLTAYEGAQAWDEVVAARQLLEIDTQLLEVRSRTTKRLQIRYDHGLAHTSEVEEARANESGQIVAVHAAEQAVTRAATLLGQVVALDSAADFVSAQDLKVLSQALSPDENTFETTLQHALDNRLDLAIAQAEVQEMVEQQDLERALVWKSVTLGPGWEGDFQDTEGGENSIGPAISIELPIFDQNQAGRAAATYKLRQATRRLEAAQQKTMKEITDLYDGLRRAQASRETLDRAVIPATQNSLRYAQEWHHKMQLPFLQVLAAQAQVLEARRRAVHARKRLNDAWRSLQLARSGGSPPML